jgi:hypothetical protein
MLTLKNNKCYIEFKEDKKEIFGKDLTDHYNDPAFYNETSRGIAKAWEALTVAWTEDTTLFDAITVLSNNKIKTHYWCMVD